MPSDRVTIGKAMKIAAAKTIGTDCIFRPTNTHSATVTVRLTAALPAMAARSNRNARIIAGPPFLRTGTLRP